MRGFTLIELIIVLAIIAVLGALSIPFIQSFQATSSLQTNADDIRQTFRRAQQLAVSGAHSDAWGVYVDVVGNSITLFKGSSYASRDTIFDLTTTFSDAFSLSNNFSDEVIFSQFSGTPQQFGTATITDSFTNSAVGVQLRTNGIIEFNQ